MKINGPNKTSGPKGTSKTGGVTNTGSSSFSGLIEETEALPSQNGVGGASSLSNIDALLSLQETPDGTSEEAAKRAKKRGIMLLDELDQLRVSLLTGDVTQEQLHQLGRMVGSQRAQVADPVLAAVLDEIDLRVQVELAKHGRR